MIRPLGACFHLSRMQRETTGRYQTHQGCAGPHVWADSGGQAPLSVPLRDGVTTPAASPLSWWTTPACQTSRATFDATAAEHFDAMSRSREARQLTTKTPIAHWKSQGRMPGDQA